MLTSLAIATEIAMALYVFTGIIYVSAKNQQVVQVIPVVEPEAVLEAVEEVEPVLAVVQPTLTVPVVSPELTIEDLRLEAKRLGVKNVHNYKKVESLQKAIDKMKGIV